uniref:Multiple epidermal growth factor-like domains protein 10 isoform X3 n=1 Tax=Crassostrea virginica TaxID=6565 RepID=A0A8B8C8K4_CRAVI|nr:multiple epidermal growth factor-like domains protein 10 isoform X3 [Crassostrea virginica]
MDLRQMILSSILLFGFVLSSNYDDLSYNKDASQSHTAAGTEHGAQNAVDRNTTTCMRTKPIGSTSPDKTAWWKVDLGGVYNIYSVNILFKNYDGYEKRQQGRFAGFSIYISNSKDWTESSLCYKSGHQLPPLNSTTTLMKSGRYVIFYNERLDGVTYPEDYVSGTVFTELCDVIVHGCNTTGMYGSNCDMPCPVNCKVNACHIQNGNCFECDPGWQGTYCDKECDYGWFGQDCKQRCIGFCNNNVNCNHLSGRCDNGCANGWKGPLCNIEQTDLSYKKKSTQSSTAIGPHDLYKADNAVDRNRATCTRTNQIGLNSPVERVWWKVDLGEVYNVNSIDIFFKNYNGYEMRQQSRFAGFSLFISKTGNMENSSVCYIDGPILPPLNLTIFCNAYGRYVIFYNERLIEVSYPVEYDVSFALTELCEVNVYGCNIAGVYGNECNIPCPNTCKEKTCNVRNGRCLSCKPGWYGSYCLRECVRSYGENCKLPCSPHCSQQKCHRFNGTCLTNCTDGFYGEKCDIADPTDERTWVIVGPISLTVNMVFIIGTSICIWGVFTKNISISLNKQPCVKSRPYTETEVTTETATYYQELAVPADREAYSNTTLR